MVRLRHANLRALIAANEHKQRSRVAAQVISADRDGLRAVAEAAADRQNAWRHDRRAALQLANRGCGVGQHCAASAEARSDCHLLIDAGSSWQRARDLIRVAEIDCCARLVRDEHACYADEIRALQRENSSAVGWAAAVAAADGADDDRRRS